MAGKRVLLKWRHNSAIDAPAKHKKACKYEAFIPDSLGELSLLQLGVETMAAVSDAEKAILELNAVAQPGLRPLAKLLLRTESIASSKVEGMQVGARDLARAEAFRQTGRKSGSVVLEILGNIDAMALAVENAAEAESFSVSEIEDVHRELMKDAPHNYIAGKVRTVQNWIGGNDYNPCGSDYVPPPPENVAELLDDLCDAVNTEAISPLIQAALVHAQFETIHPFDDGNGRTGRALTQIVLKRRGLAPSYVPPISVMLAKSRDRYIAGLTTFREDGGIEPWIGQFAEATARAAYLAKRYLVAIQNLGAGWKQMLADSVNPRVDAAAWKVIDILPAHPIITAPVAEAATGLTGPSIYNAIQQLQKAGVLIPLSEQLRNQSWEAVGLFDLLARLEAGDETI